MRYPVNFVQTEEQLKQLQESYKGFDGSLRLEAEVQLGGMEVLGIWLGSTEEQAYISLKEIPTGAAAEFIQSLEGAFFRSPTPEIEKAVLENALGIKILQGFGSAMAV